MTRSDLINSLGVGGRLSRRALGAARRLESDSSGGGGDTNEEEESSDDSDDESTTCLEDLVEKDKESEESESVVSCPCSAEDIGGFYSALCALAVGVEIGTKVCGSTLE